MLNFFLYFKKKINKRKCYKTQNNRKFKPKIFEKSIKLFTSLIKIKISLKGFNFLFFYRLYRLLAKNEMS